jgi:outer membrane protein OmpA-like peptidoglycan-associated protein
MPSPDLHPFLHARAALASVLLSLALLAGCATTTTPSSRLLSAEQIKRELETRGYSTTYIHFATNSAEIEAGSEEQVVQIANALNEPYANLDHFQIVGHTDSMGSEQYNMQLSDRRAKAVVKSLTGRYGLSPNILRAVPMGKSQLLVFPEQSDDDRARNRRVEIRYVVKK